MKKFLALLLAMTMVMALVACGGDPKPTEPTTPPADTQQPADADPAPADPEPAPAGASEITLWTYPIGDWGTEATVKTLTDAFTAETGIAVKVEYLAYADGDDKVNTAITAKGTPDLIMEGPERLVANWGANGYLVDLKDMFDDTDMAEINAVNEGVMNACTHTNGAIYEYPLVMTAHCMAFKEAGADQYLNLDTHTWTTDDFIKAVEALYSHYNATVGAVFCAGQGGDQGTRALVNNLYGGTFTNAEHKTGAEKTVTGEQIAFMSFPSQDGNSKLQGGIWGFGIFDNGDQARIDAAKQFIKFMCDSAHTVDAVQAARYFAVRNSAEGTDLSTIWADNAIMNEYTKLMPFLGDYYQVTTGWAGARTEWWNMLQEVGAGNDIAQSVANHVAAANTAAG